MIKYLILCIFIVGCTHKTEHPEDKLGQVEYIQAFTFLPTECYDGYTYWFKTVWFRKSYMEIGGFTSFQVIEYYECIGNSIK